MDFIDSKYCGILSVKLPKYKTKTQNPYSANFRCVICGDSEKSKNKTRGWLLEKANSIFYYCHNCGYSKPLRIFLKSYDYNLYNDYVKDKAIERYSLKQNIPEEKKETKSRSIEKLHGAVSISDLEDNHPAKIYVVNRKIPKIHYKNIYYISKFNKWVNTLIKDKLDEKLDEPRLILPLINKQNKIFGFSGRSFKKNGLRYMTIMLDENTPKIFGLNNVDFNKRYFITEGPIDSLFLENSIAMVGADIKIESIENKQNAVYVFDNEPRNSAILKRMNNILDSNNSVVIWPENIKEKDINDMILSGISENELTEMINNNIYSGLLGKMKLTQWRKTD